jgi:Arc/MetJ-type ribon-helix-helix transcriptional regulator
MQRTKDGCRWTVRLSNKDYAQKEVIRMFEYLLASGEYATESDIFREGIKSLYREKTEPDRIVDWNNRIQEYARITADNMMERMQNMLDVTVRKGGLVAVTRTVADADEAVEADVGMAPPEAVEELSDEVDDFLNDFYGYL